VKVLGALFLALGLLGIIAAVLSSVAFGLLVSLVSAPGDDGAALDQAVLGVTGLGLTIAIFATSTPAIFCGWGLLKFRPWARILGIVLAAIALIGFPYGTLFGVYALWVLFSKRTETVFDP